MSSESHPLVAYIPELPKKHRKLPEDRRTKRIAVPVSPSEFAQITHLALVHGCTFTAVMRTAVHSIPPPLSDRKVLKDIRLMSLELKDLLVTVPVGIPLPEDVRARLHYLLDSLTALETP
jgi:hypothetical protein